MQGFSEEILPERIEAWRFLLKTEGLTLHLRKILELPLHPKRKCCQMRWVENVFRGG